MAEKHKKRPRKVFDAPDVKETQRSQFYISAEKSQTTLNILRISKYFKQNRFIHSFIQPLFKSRGITDALIFSDVKSTNLKQNKYKEKKTDRKQTTTEHS